MRRELKLLLIENERIAQKLVSAGLRLFEGSAKRDRDHWAGGRRYNSTLRGVASLPIRLLPA
jgi:hypothetical protein